MLLNDADRVDDVVEAEASLLDGHVEFCLFFFIARRVFDEAFHLCARSSIAQGEIVEHVELLACESSICVLDSADVGAHLVGVVCHVDDGAVRVVCRLCGVASEPLHE